jgi:hypothetical protein
LSLFVELAAVVGIGPAGLPAVPLAPLGLPFEQVRPAHLPVTELLEPHVEAVGLLDHHGDLADAALEVVDSMCEMEKRGMPDVLADLGVLAGQLAVACSIDGTSSQSCSSP